MGQKTQKIYAQADDRGHFDNIYSIGGKRVVWRYTRIGNRHNIFDTFLDIDDTHDSQAMQKSKKSQTKGRKKRSEKCLIYRVQEKASPAILCGAFCITQSNTVNTPWCLLRLPIPINNRQIL